MPTKLALLLSIEGQLINVATAYIDRLANALKKGSDDDVAVTLGHCFGVSWSDLFLGQRG